MEYKYKATPMTHRPLTTQKIMIRLFIGLLAVYAYGLYNAYSFGKEYLINGILLLVVSLVVGTITEVLYALACKKNILQHLKTSFHYITCIILVLCEPANASLYVMGVSTIIALFFGKLVFGGFGQNVFNPAAIGKAVILTSFSGKVAFDAMTGPTIATAFNSMNWISNSNNYLSLIREYGGVKNIVFGNYFGAMGETCTLLILVVGVVLSVVDVIDWRIPATYLGTMFFGSAIIGFSHGLGIDYPLVFISTGGIAFGAVFMLTDPVTNPQTRPGKILFSTIAAVLTVLIRYLGNLPEGVVFSILIVNILSPSIDHFFGYKQIESYKRNIIIVFSSIIAVIAIIAVVGIRAEEGKYIKPNTESTGASVSETTGSSTESAGSSTNESAGSGFAIDGDYSSNKAEIISSSGNIYQVKAKGFEGFNVFEIEVEKSENQAIIKAIKCAEFKDTEGIGTNATNDSYLNGFVGLGLDGKIDAKSGATYTSKSVIAAVQAALKEAQ